MPASHTVRDGCIKGVTGTHGISLWQAIALSAESPSLLSHLARNLGVTADRYPFLHISMRTQGGYFMACLSYLSFDTFFIRLDWRFSSFISCDLRPGFFSLCAAVQIKHLIIDSKTQHPLVSPIPASTLIRNLLIIVLAAAWNSKFKKKYELVLFLVRLVWTINDFKHHIHGDSFWAPLLRIATLLK